MQSSALLVRRDAAAQVGWLDPDFFVYSDETDFQKRLHDAGWRVLYVPGARAIHHEQLSTDAAAAARRITEFHRGRDRYMRKHHTAATALIVRALTALAYGIRALAVVTVGLSNRVAAGRDRAAAWSPSTINTIVVVDAVAEAAALVNAVITATEVKTLALTSAGVRCADGRLASGTSTTR